MLGIGLLAYLLGRPLFGGEDPLGEAPNGDNWHHEGLTRQAATRAGGWSEDAKNALAFHADYIDSYLYNPLWWFDVANGGGPARVPVVMSSQADLVKVHFDDLVDPEAIPSMWRRYLSGTVAGLIWLGHAEGGSLDRRAAMAHNLLGVSLHANQDFYSHSNWIDDDDLRCRTWFEVDPDQRACLSLWSGTYELPHHFGIKPHGAFLYACTVINNLGPAGRGLMNVMCHAASPFADSSLCRWFKQCEEGTSPDPGPVKLPVAGSVDPPEGVVWVEPGINLDNRWMAEIGRDVRGLTISAQDAFEAAYELACRSSCQWLHILDHVMGDPELGLAEFWQAVKDRGVTRAQYKTPTAPWEDFSQIPYRFVSAGPYPPLQGHDDAGDWYLRLLVRTAADAYSGTDADIVPIVNGVQLPVLDHGVPASTPPIGQVATRTVDQTLMGRNDFEAGDVAAYMIGPLPEAPHTVALLNSARDFDGTITAAFDALWRSLVYALESALDFFKGLWGYHADFVDEDHEVIAASTLSALGAGARHGFVLDCDGKSEGRYLIHGYVEGTSVTGAFPNGVPWRRYVVRFDTLLCVKESDWDRFTPSDEPFVLGLVIPHGGRRPMVSWRTAPFSDVDSGEIRTIGTTFTVEVPQRYGFISLACAVYESDDETPNDRDLLLAEFSRKVGAGIVQPEDSFFEVLGESIAAGWRLGSVEAVAFRRSPTVEVRSYPPRTFDRWVEGSERVEWTLGEPATWTAEVPDTISCDCGGCTDAATQPPLKPQTTRIDFRPAPDDERPEPVKDPGREILIDLAELDPRWRPPVPVDDSIGEVAEPASAPRPSDGCP